MLKKRLRNGIIPAKWRVDVSEAKHTIVVYKPLE